MAKARKKVRGRKKAKGVSRMSRPEVVKAVRQGKKKIVSKRGFTKPAIDYGKKKKGIKLMCRGKRVA